MRRTHPLPSRAVGLAVALLCLASGIACSGVEDGAVPGDDALTLLEIEFAPAREDGTPDDYDSVAWRPVTLPHGFETLDGPLPHTGWYRGDLELNVPPHRLWAVYLPSLSMNAAVYLNGELLGDGGRFAPPLSRNWNRPLYFTISYGLLVTGTNTFHVRVAGEPWRRAHLGTLYVGPDELLRPVYENRFFSRVTLSRTVSAMVFVVSAFALALWIRRAEAIYGWFALATLLWAVAMTDLFVRDVPFPAPYWGAALRIVQAALLLVLLVFFHRLRGAPIRWAEAGVMGLIAFASLALWLAGDVERPVIDLAFVLLCLALGGYLAWSIAAFFVTRPSPETGIVALLGLVLLGLMGHDWVVQAWPGEAPSDPVAHLGAPLLAAAIGWILVSRFVGALEESETLNARLEQRVREKHAELEQSFRQTREMEREGALAGERERIMRDMHDGMGGHLVSALSIVEGGEYERDELSEILRGALEDMRLVIDSLDPVDEDLATVLSMLRARLEPRLKRHGLSFRWQVADLPAIAGMGPQRVLQVLRILQEALNNVVKHAAADEVAVITGEDDAGQRVFVEVRDDGAGVPEDVQRGRGLYNMERRAEAVGGSLEIHSSPEGTAVRLWLPLADRQQEPSFHRWLESLRGGSAPGSGPDGGGA